jgi:hypothetical protein
MKNTRKRTLLRAGIIATIVSFAMSLGILLGIFKAPTGDLSNDVVSWGWSWGTVWDTVTSFFKPKTGTIFHSYLIDIHDPKALSGFADFVFVGRVEKQTEVVYEDVFERETEKGFVTTGTPYTGFSVTVLDNLKQELRLDEPVIVWQRGGLSMDGKYFSISEDDIMPETGAVYVFFASASLEGTLTINGAKELARSTLTLENQAKSGKTAAELAALEQEELQAVLDSAKYKELAEAVANEIPFERQRLAVNPAYLAK